MALNTFGWTPSEVTTDSAGNVISGVTLTVFTDVTKASQVTTLYDKDGVTALANGVVVSDNKGRFGFKASDAYSMLYVYDGSTADPWPIAAHEALDQGMASHAQAVADAQAAADSAATSASNAQAAANLVGAPADAAIAAAVNGAATSTRSALNANYAGRRGLDPAPLADVTVTARVNNIAPIDVLADGRLYGHKAVGGNALYVSDDSGATWTLANSNLPALISGAEGTGLRDVPGGEVLLMLRAGGLYRSTGWSANKATATWTQVLTCTTGAWILPGQVDVYGNRVIACEYGIPRENSRKLSVSLDGGLTFTMVKDLNVDFPGQETLTHWHAVGIDRWQGSGRFWASHGDGPNRLLYSDDGTTWTEYNPGTGLQPMSITATDGGLVLGSDAEPNGLAFIDRKTMTLSQTLTWRGGPSVIGFANKAVRHSDGTVYVAFQSTVNTVSAPIIAATPDGSRGLIVHKLKPAGATQPNIRNLMIDSHGKVIAPALNDGADVVITATLVGGGTVPYERINASGALEGTADATSVSVGWRSNASIYGVAAGQMADARSTDSAIAIGNGALGTVGQAVALGKGASVTAVGGVAAGGAAVAKTGVALGLNSAADDGVSVGNAAKSVGGSGVAVGNAAKVYTTTAVALGTNAVTLGGGSPPINQTAVGYGANTNATHGTAVGTGAGVSAAAAQGTAVGRNAQVTGNAGTAVGASASAAHDSSVALGVGQATTTFSQVRIGNKHIEMAEMTAPAAPAADGARLYTKDNGAGKTQLCVKFSDGIEIVIATQA